MPAKRALWSVFRTRKLGPGESSAVCEKACESVSRSFMSDSLTPWTVSHQAPLSMEFSSKNTGVGCHSLLQGDLPDPGVGPKSPALQADSLPSEPLRELREAPKFTHLFIYLFTFQDFFL